MNAERLLQHYEQIADAPDAITRLRRFILDLAVRGKLVPQDPADEPASELLMRIAEEKARLLKAGEIRTPKPFSAVVDVPFSIPSNWSWSQIAEIGIMSPRNDAPDAMEASFVPMPLIAAEYGVANRHEVRTWGEIKKGYTHFAEGDVGLAKITPCFENGKSTVFRSLTGGIGSGTTELHVVRPLLVVADYILLFWKSPHFIETGIPKMTGTAGQKRVPTDYFANSPFPLPPIAEQHRIVAKVDELMALCDELETARMERETKRDRLAAASLARLNTPDPETFRDDARFALDALPALTARPDQIKRLRQTILNLAVRGKLVPQDPADEPAAQLLTRLKKQRTALEDAGEIRREKSERPSHDIVEQGFELPGSWSWARLSELGQTQTGTSPSSSNPDLFGDFIPFIKPADLDGNQINYEGPGLSEIGVAHSRLAAENSILMVCIGATLGKVNTTVRPVCFNQQINSLTPFLDGLTSFVAIALKASSFQSLAWSKAGTGTLPIISKGKWEVLPIPLPPLAEQSRIVAKVDELMALCDQLETSLTSADDTQKKLLDALLAEALAPVDNEVLQEAAE